jgi:hypothetical protein
LKETARLLRTNTANAITAAPDGTLWLAGHDDIEHIATNPLRSAGPEVGGPMGGPIVSLAVSPDNTTLYDLLNERQVVEARRTSDGIKFAEHALNGPGSGTLAATVGGVWAAYPTGSLGSVDMLRAGRLAPGPRAEMPAGQGGSNGITVAVGGRILWIYDENTGSVVCADPVSGKVRDIVRPASYPPPLGVLAVDQNKAYLASSSGIAVLTPPAKCR